MPFPDFTNSLLFPPVNSIPIPDLSPVSIASDGTFTVPEVLHASDSSPKHYLLAEIKHNMTITKPTLICVDRKGTEFAVTFNTPVDLKARGLKKGNTVVVPNARLIPPKTEGGQSSVQVFAGEEEFVKVIPGGLGRVMEGVKGLEGKKGECACCGKREGKLNKCTGCGTVRYCGKECQVKDWGEGGHKGLCKVLKAVREIWPGE